MTTRTPGRIVGLDEFIDVVRVACTEHPSNTNPQTGTICLYRRDRDGCMCLIGHVLVEGLGFAYDPDWDDRPAADVGAETLLRDLGFPDDVCVVAGEVQRCADGLGEGPVPWGRVERELDDIVSEALQER